MRKSVLLVEPNHSGHHFFYVSLIAREALQRGLDVTVATSQRAAASSEFATHLASIADKVRWDFTVPRDPSWGDLVRAWERNPADVTVVPDGDRLASRFGRPPVWPGWSVKLLVMRSEAQSVRLPALSPLKSLAKRSFIRRNGAARPNMEFLWLRSSVYPFVPGERVALDPVEFECREEDLLAARAFLTEGKADGWAAVLGAISARKNVPLIARALQRPEAAGLGLLVAGPISEADGPAIAEAVRQLRARGREVVVIDRHLGDRELDAFVALADCVVLAHSNEGPSGLFGKALAAGTPLVTAGARSLRADSARFPARAQWTPLNEEALAVALAEARGRPRVAVPLRTTEQFTSVMLGLADGN